MIELELLVNEIEKLYNKEKSLRKKIHLETALKALRDFEKLSSN